MVSILNMQHFITLRKALLLLVLSFITFYVFLIQSPESIYRLKILYTFNNNDTILNELGKNISLNENEKLMEAEIRANGLIFKLNSSTNCYEIDNKPPLWLYWDQENKIPTFARILADAIQCVNSEFRVILVHDSNLDEFWPDFPQKMFSMLVAAHKADVVRVNLLRIFGGVYLDVDNFPIQSYYPYYNLLSEYDLIAPNWDGVGPIATGSMGPARAGHPFFNVWSYWQLECMRHNMLPRLKEGNNKDPFGWPELLAYIATPLAEHMIRNNVLKLYHFHGQSTIGQLLLMKSDNSILAPLANITKLLNNLKPTPILAVLHAPVAKQIDNLSLNQILYHASGDTAFTYFVKCALMQCYAHIPLTDGIGLSNIGKVNISDYLEFVYKPFAYKCYSFNDTVVPKM